eukprot:403356932
MGQATQGALDKEEIQVDLKRGTDNQAKINEQTQPNDKSQQSVGDQKQVKKIQAQKQEATAVGSGLSLQATSGAAPQQNLKEKQNVTKQNANQAKKEEAKNHATTRSLQENEGSIQSGRVQSVQGAGKNRPQAKSTINERKESNLKVQNENSVKSYAGSKRNRDMTSEIDESDNQTIMDELQSIDIENPQKTKQSRESANPPIAVKRQRVDKNMTSQTQGSGPQKIQQVKSRQRTLTKKQLEKLDQANMKNSQQQQFKMSQFHNLQQQREDFDILSEDGEQCAHALLDLILLSHQQAVYPLKKGQQQNLLKVSQKGQPPVASENSSGIKQQEVAQSKVIKGQKKQQNIYKYEEFAKQGPSIRVEQIEPTPAQQQASQIEGLQLQYLEEIMQDLSPEQIQSIFGNNIQYIEKLMRQQLETSQDVPQLQEFMYQLAISLKQINEGQQAQKEQQEQQLRQAEAEEFLQQQMLQCVLEGQGYDLQDLLPSLGIHNPDVLKHSPYAHLLLRQQLVGQTEVESMPSHRLYQETQKIKSMSHIGIAYYIKTDIETKQKDIYKDLLQNQHIQGIDEANALAFLQMHQQMQGSNLSQDEIEQLQMAILQHQQQQNQELKMQEDLRHGSSQNYISDQKLSNSQDRKSINQLSKTSDMNGANYNISSQFSMRSPDKVAIENAQQHLNLMTPEQQIAFITDSIQNSATNEKARQTLKSLSIEKIQNITEHQMSEINNKLQMERDQYHEIMSQVQSQRHTLSPEHPSHLLQSAGSVNNLHRLENSASRLDTKQQVS